MKQGLQYLILIPLTFFFGACQLYEPPPPPPPTQVLEPPAKVFEPATEDSQLPETKLKAASQRYGGALDAGGGPAPGLAGQTSRVQAPPAGQDGRRSLVLGPVVNENGGSGNMNAGQSLREAIARELTTTRDIQLIDAPEERYKNDSPRPDLARRGIRYVIKGVANLSPKSGQTTVFLRAVNTGSGEVEAVASGRRSDPNQAAADAARGLLKKLEN